MDPHRLVCNRFERTHIAATLDWYWQVKPQLCQDLAHETIKYLQTPLLSTCNHSLRRLAQTSIQSQSSWYWRSIGWAGYLCKLWSYSPMVQQVWSEVSPEIKTKASRVWRHILHWWGIREDPGQSTLPMESGRSGWWSGWCILAEAAWWKDCKAIL